MPQVSVIVPCYRAGKYLARFCAQLKAQTYSGEWEAVFVDDGDEECDYGPVLEGGPRFRLARIIHSGVSAARNAGLGEAKGEIILFADPDDEVGPDWMKNLVESVEGVDLGWCGFMLDGRPTLPPDLGRIYEGDDVKRRVWRAVFGYTLRDVIRWWTPKRMWKGCRRELAGVWCKAFRRSVIGTLRFDETLRLYEDAIFLAEYAAKAKSMRVSDRADYVYEMREDGMMARWNRERMVESKFELRDARRRIDPGMKWWRGTFLLSAVEIMRTAGVKTAIRYLLSKEA